MLDPLLAGAAVADFFSGSGSFGLEALSRGARHGWFAELDAAAVTALKQNIEMLGVAAQATIWRGDILHRLDGWLADLPGPLDIISLDPPFEMARHWFGLAGRPQPDADAEPHPSDRREQAARQQAAHILASLAAALAPDGLIVVRTPHNVRVAELPADLVEDRRREYGAMALTFLRRGMTPNPAE